LRDPWRLVQRLPEGLASPVGLWMAGRAEEAAVRAAHLVVTNTQPLCDAMRATYPGRADRIITVTNGHDDDVVPQSAPHSRFVIAYAGSIYLDRDPRPLFRAIRGVVAARGLTPNQLAVEFLGHVEAYDGRSLLDIAADEGVAPFLTVLPVQPRHSALRSLAQATVLTVMPQDSDMAIPAKLFDYMQCDAWILAFARRGSAVQALLRDSAADVVDPGDASGALARLLARYDAFVRGERGTRLAVMERFSRRAQANILFDAIGQVARIPGPAPAVEAPTCAA
jgi:hypothetical protein